VRTVEALKTRYYAVVQRIATARGMPEAGPERSYVYDSEHEARRKAQLERLLNRTPAEVCVGARVCV
jgi:hypothetical protein